MTLPVTRPVYLIGFMSAGKTTVGRLVARQLSVAFVDTDEEIERRCGITVAEIFARDGEARFRHLERELLGQLAARREVVVATGGGMPVAPENWRLMAASGTIVALLGELKVLAKRMANAAGQRPLARDGGELARRFAERQAVYERAPWRVRTDEATPAEVAEQVCRLLAEADAAEPRR